MKTYTDKQVVDAATRVMDNTRTKLAEKEGAVAASVAIMMLLGIEVVFVDHLRSAVN